VTRQKSSIECALKVQCLHMDDLMLLTLLLYDLLVTRTYLQVTIASKLIGEMIDGSD